jgi:hypothetical protein
MVQAGLMDEKVDLGSKLQNKFNFLFVMDNADSLITNKAEFNWSIANMLTQYESMRIVLISRNQIKFEAIDSIKGLLMIKQMPPLTDDESLDLIVSNCKRDFSQAHIGEDQSSHLSVLPYDLKLDPNFMLCHGFPDLLHLFATALSS